MERIYIMLISNFQHFLFDRSNTFPFLTLPPLSLPDLRRLIENHQCVIEKASTAVKVAWRAKSLEVEGQKRKELREALVSFASKRNAILAKEQKTKEAEFQKRQALRQEAEEAIREKRKRNIELSAALRREEMELLKRDAAHKIIVEEENLCETSKLEEQLGEEGERMLKEHADKMSELDERIREATFDLKSSLKSRYPLAVLNLEEISSRQTLPTQSKGDEGDPELVENVEGIGSPSEGEKIKEIISPKSSPDATKCSQVCISASNQHQEPVYEVRQPLIADRNKSNEAGSAKVTHFQSKRQFNREDFEGTRAKDIIYGKGLGPSARDSAWEKPKPREHLPDEDIIAFSQELLEPSQLKASPWSDPSVTTGSDVGTSNAFSAFLRSLDANSNHGQICSSKYQKVPFFSALDRVIARPLQARCLIADSDEEGQIREPLMGLLECANRFRRTLLLSQHDQGRLLDALAVLQDRFREDAQVLHGILKVRVYETSALSHLLQTLQYFCTTIC
ncbi:unnamed protein product [Rodentolepis nana]|uniref:Centrosomal protein of 131 kDa n=1 Tax=Rodentolepis nana TaxID=102285 RepID=A0A158QJG8_RODNA|nr:unnamed protein product [Rodentolepis nana]